MSVIPRVEAGDGTRLHTEVDGDGPPLLLLHEVASDLRSWDPLVEHLRDHFTCIRYNARGYPPSDVPRVPEAYGQSIAVDDALAVMDAVGIESAHVLGFSMGGFCALHTALKAPQRVRSAMVIGVGYGSNPDDRERFVAEMASAGQRFRDHPQAAARAYAGGPTRMQLKAKDPAAWSAFQAALAQHDPVGQSLTFTEVLGRRPSLFTLREDLTALEMPIMFVVGDEDDGCLETNVMLKRAIASSALTVLPRTGHTPSLEDPARFNGLVLDFLQQVDRGRWSDRAAGSVARGLVGM